MNRPGWLIILALTLGLSSLSPAEIQGEKTDSTSKPELETGIEQACELIKSENFASAVELLHKLAAENPADGKANFYLGLTTLADEKRKRSTVIEEASRHFAAAANNGYHLPFGAWEDFPIREKKFTDANWAAAQKYLKKKDPHNTEIAAHLLHNIITVDHKARDAGEKLGKLYLSIRQVRKVIELYWKILQANPDKNQKIYSLDLDFLDIYLPKQANLILEGLSSKKPEELSPMEKLFMARALFTLEKDSLACSYYSQCLETLDKVTAGELFRDVTDIVFEDDRLLYENAATLKEKQAFFRRLWKSRDPPTGLSYNGRLAEHYRRLNHAKQNFHINMINGYDDRGRIYIKHGEPDQKVSDFAYEYENESWLYRKKPKDFIFHFLRRYTNYEILPNLPPLLYESRVELDPFYFKVAESTMEENELLLPAVTLGETTETYNPYQGMKPLDYYFYTADFMSRNANSNLYVYYGLPVNKLELQPDSSGSWVDYECAITLFDQEWNQVARPFDERNYLLKLDPDKAGKGSLVIDRQVVSLPPGQYYYTVSVEDLNSGHIGVYRDTVEVTPYEHGSFNVSQVVLAANISQVEKGQKPGKFTRGRLKVMALPSRTFRRDQKVFIYCEIYYLSEDNQGRKRYNIDFSIKADKLDNGLASKIFSPFGKLLGKKEDKTSVTLTFDKEQENPDRAVQQEYISIDIIESPPGKYDLNITVTDNATGEKVTRDANFSIVKTR